MAERVNFNDLINTWDPALRRAFLKSIQNVTNTSQINQITAKINGGDIEGAVRAVNLDPANFRIYDKTFGQVFEAGGTRTAATFPRLGDPTGLRTIFQFNVRNPAAENWLRNHSAQFVSDITADQRNLIRTVVTKGLEEGRNPRSVALDLVGRVETGQGRAGGYIGLTNSQEKWVANYTSNLRTNPEATLPHYFNNVLVPGSKLRDKRFDKVVKEYIDKGEPLPAELIDKMSAAYRNRALNYRAQAIARTETMAAIHEAQDQAITQAVEKGLIDGENITYIWRTAHDKRVRDSHAAMAGQEVSYGERFETGNGNLLRFPGDPEGPPDEIINCRCWREPKIDFLAGVS